MPRRAQPPRSFPSHAPAATRRAAAIREASRSPPARRARARARARPPRAVRAGGPRRRRGPSARRHVPPARGDRRSRARSARARAPPRARPPFSLAPEAARARGRRARAARAEARPRGRRRPRPPVRARRRPGGEARVAGVRRSGVRELDGGRGRAGPVDDVGQDPVEGEGRPPTDLLPDLVDRRLPVEHVLDPLSVDLVIGDEHELGGRSRPLQHPVGEVQDADALGRADVVDLAVRRGLLGEARQRSDRVRDMAEAAALRAVAVDLERTPGERGLHEARDDHPVLAALARPDGVEEPDDHAVESALLVVGEREELVHRLRVRVGPAALRRRPVGAAIAPPERPPPAVVAAYLRGGGDQPALAEPVAPLEHVLRPLEIGGRTPPRPAADNERVPADRRRTSLRIWGPVLLFVALAVAGAAAYVVLAPKHYRATAEVLVTAVTDARYKDLPVLRGPGAVATAIQLAK